MPSRTLQGTLGVLAVGVLLTACSGAPNLSATGSKRDEKTAEPPRSASTPVTTGVDYERLARRIVMEQLNVREGEIVMVTGSTRDAEFLESVAVNVRALGAHPLLLMNSERTNRRMWTDVPERHDAQELTLDLKLMDMVDAVVRVETDETEDLLADIPQSRFTARASAFEAVYKRFAARKIRVITLGNAMYPTAWRAKRLGMSEDQLRHVFWAGVNVDPGELRAVGEAIRGVLRSAKEVHITDRNGTDLRVQIAGRPVFFSDGVITPDEAQAGGRDVQAWLPAGDVYLSPVPQTADGVVVVARAFHRRQEIKNLKLTFRRGRLVSMAADAGVEGLLADYDSVSDPRKAEFAYLDFGANPAVILPPESAVGAWMPAGAITVGIGANTWAGGDNYSPFGREFNLPSATVLVDGRDVITDGRLKQEIPLK